MSYLFGRTLMSSWDLYEWLCKTRLSNANKILFNSFECTECKKTTGKPKSVFFVEIFLLLGRVWGDFELIQINTWWGPFHKIKMPLLAFNCQFWHFKHFFLAF